MTSSSLKSKIFSLIFVILLTVGCTVFVFSGDNYDILKSLFLEDHTGDELRDKLNDLGFKGCITIVVLTMMQVVLTFIPAEPIQVISGLTFGFPIGILLSLTGFILGTSVIYLLYKRYGNRLREYFINDLHLDLDAAAKSPKITVIVLMLFLLPAIPYGVICFFSASVGMKYPRYLLLTSVASLPSVCVGVGLGHIALAASWILTLSIFVVLVIVITILMIKKRAIFEMINRYINKPPYSSKTTVKSYSVKKLSFLNVCARIVLFFKGVKVKYETKLDGEIETPSIALANHGSFLDFCYSGTILRKKAPHFITARLYFYKKSVGRILRAVGCFPKSMFASDIESAKNCLRVLKSGGIIGMMPEARLSTVGKFEDIQEGTFTFLKQARVPVYQIKISGDYLASPKWGHTLRRGSLIEVELLPLFTRDEIEALSVEEIKARVLSRMYYDEMAWLDTHPEVKYRSGKLAEGLENVLTLCPKCQGKYTIRTQGKKISCERCGDLTSLNSRYRFDDGFTFSTIPEWYEWRFDKLREEILKDEGYTLSSPVKYCLPSLDGKTMLRDAGEGVATLSREGLTYIGTKDGEEITLTFPIDKIYRLLFGAGESFEIYEGQTINFFKPEEGRSAVDWYIASIILKDEA